MSTEVEREMQSHGLVCSDTLIDNGKINRFHVEGDSKGTANGFYRFWDDDNPTVYCGSHKTGEAFTFSSKNPQALSPEDRQRHQARIAEAKEESARIRIEEAQAASIEAQRIWDASKPTSPHHEYLKRKGIEPHGIRELDRRIVVPIYGESGTLASIQFIQSDGQKRFLPGGSIKGNSYSIGTPTERVYICEGYATSATIYEATGCMTIVAFNAGNLRPVAQAIRHQFQQAEIIVAADNDAETERKTGNNPGLIKARESADAINARVAFPSFKESESGSDFNDLFLSEGLEAVRAQLRAAQVMTPQEVEPWPEPVPLVDDALPSLPLTGLPTWFKAMVEAVASSTETPPELAAMLGLAALSTAAHRAFEIEPEPGYREPLNIWAIAAMESGNRKTSVLNAMASPLGIFEREQEKATAGERKKSESQLKTLESRIKHLRTEAARIDDTEEFRASCEIIAKLESELPTVQAPLQLWLQDVTPEKLATVMAEQNGSLAIISDEGGVFETFAGRYNGGVPNLDLILKSHSGSPVRSHRASREAVNLDHPSLVFGLSPQPEVLRGLSDKPGFRGRGLLARFLYVIPQSLLGGRSLDSTTVPESIASGYLNGLTNILKMEPPKDGERHILKFSQQAHGEWKDFARWIESEMRPDGRFEHMKDWAGKLPGATARIAGLLHIAELHGEEPHEVPIAVETMKATNDLVMVFSDHAIHAFNVMGTDPDIEDAKKILAWIQRKECQAFTKRDCHNGLQKHFPRVDGLMTGIKILVERYIIRLEETPAREGRPSARYEVNPAIFQEGQDYGMA